MTTPALVKEADIVRAIRAAKKLGAKRVKIGPDGSIDILLEDDKTTDALPHTQPDPFEPLVTIDDRPKRKLVF